MASWENMDFSPIASLPQVYKQSQLDANRERTLAQLGQGAKLSDVATQLFKVGDVQGGLSLSNLANTIEQQNSTRAFQNAQIANMQSQRQLEERKVNISENDPKIIPYGSGVMKKDGTMIQQPNAGGLLDDETISAMADQYRAGDTSVLTNLGRGAQGAENIVKLRKAIAVKNSAVGDGGADQASRNAEYFGVKAGQRTLGTRSAGIEMAATEFKNVLPVVMQASNAVQRTNYPDLNKIIQSYETRTGDPNIVKFGGGVNTLINLYARAISPTGNPTVSDKDHARDILSKAWSQGQFNAAVGMMQQEIDAALASPEQVRNDMRKRFLGGQGGTNAPAKPEVAAPPGPPSTAIDWRFYFGAK